MKNAAKQPVLKAFYLSNVVEAMKATRNYKNIHELPRLEKIVINSGINADSDKAWVAEIVKDISKVAGQKAVITRARDSISNFKLRKGMPTGVKVTLRGNRMYEFLYLLISVALPAIRDFRGVSNKLDGHGNYTIGISDHSVFPQIVVEGGRKNIGMDITIVTTANTDDEAKELLALMSMPFRKSSSQQQEASIAA